jgi:hypothetical protein
VIARSQFEQGEYLESFKTISNMLMPVVFWYNSFLGLGLSALMVAHRGSKLFTNLDDLDKLSNGKTIEAVMRSLTSFKDLSTKLSETSLKFAYDFTQLAKGYESQINNLNLLLDSVKVTMTSEEAASIMSTKPISITSNGHKYEYCVQLSRFESADIDSRQYHCYNTELQAIDHIVIAAGDEIRVEHL